MIRVETTKNIPNLIWHETSAKEFGMLPWAAHQLMIDLSDPVKIIYSDEAPMLVAGLFRQTLLSVPYLWVFLTKDFAASGPSTIRNIIRVTDVFAPRCETLVEEGNERAERLARTFRFKPSSSTLIVGDKLYRMYRRG